jgi:hypothetical protein
MPFAGGIEGNSNATLILSVAAAVIYGLIQPAMSMPNGICRAPETQLRFGETEGEGVVPCEGLQWFSRWYSDY